VERVDGISGAAVTEVGVASCITQAVGLFGTLFESGYERAREHPWSNKWELLGLIVRFLIVVS